MNGRVEGKEVTVGKTARIGENVLISGDEVRIEDNVVVGDNTVIKASRIRIGFGTTVEEDCRIHRLSGQMEELSLGDQCFIGNNSRIAIPIFRTGDYVALHNHLFVNGGKPCIIGHNVWIGQNCILNARDNLTIGNGVGIGTYSCIWTHGAHGELLEGCRIFKVAPVVVEDDVWIVGSYNVISPGVTLGKKSIILTGSVVTKDVSPGACVAGNPAKDITDKLQPYREITIDEKLEMMKGFMEDFASSRQNAAKTDSGWHIGTGEDAFDIVFMQKVDDTSFTDDACRIVFTKNNRSTRGLPRTTMFDLTTKTYTKKRTKQEIAVMKFLLYAKARFCPI